MLNQKCKTLAAMLALTLACAGCGGIRASQGVSPLFFLMPGLGMIQDDHKPSSTNTVSQPQSIEQFAQAQ
jgi:hypothetical protein